MEPDSTPLVLSFLKISIFTFSISASKCFFLELALLKHFEMDHFKWKIINKHIFD